MTFEKTLFLLLVLLKNIMVDHRRVPNDPPVKSDAEDAVDGSGETTETTDTASDAVIPPASVNSNVNSSSIGNGCPTPKTSPLSRSSSGRNGMKSSPTAKSPKSPSMRQSSPVGGTYINNNSSSSNNNSNSSNNNKGSDKGILGTGDKAETEHGTDKNGTFRTMGDENIPAAAATAPAAVNSNSPSKKRSVDGGMKGDGTHLYSTTHLHCTSEKAADTSTSLILQDDDDEFATSPSGRRHTSSSSISSSPRCHINHVNNTNDNRLTKCALQVDTNIVNTDHDGEFDNGTGSGVINSSEPPSPFSPSQQSSSSSQYHHQYVGRLYNVLFDGVNRAVDDLYRLCEEQVKTPRALPLPFPSTFPLSLGRRDLSILTL